MTPRETAAPVAADSVLTAARRKQQAGQYRAARDILLQGIAKTSNSIPLLNQLGSLQQDLGEYREAERSYLLALHSVSQTECSPERISLLSNLATLYLDTGQYEKGEQIREELKKVPLEASEVQPAEAAVLMNLIASLEHVRNRDDEAERDYGESLRLFHNVNGPISVDAALVEANLAFVQMDGQRYAAAAELLGRAIREIEMASNAENPALVRLLVNLARCENVTRHPDQAEPVAARAFTLAISIFGERHPVAAAAMMEQAAALRGLRRKKQARDLEKRAQIWLGETSGRDPSGYIVSLRDLARPRRLR